MSHRTPVEQLMLFPSLSEGPKHVIILPCPTAWGKSPLLNFLLPDPLPPTLSHSVYGTRNLKTGSVHSYYPVQIIHFMDEI